MFPQLWQHSTNFWAWDLYPNVLFLVYIFKQRSTAFVPQQQQHRLYVAHSKTRAAFVLCIAHFVIKCRTHTRTYVYVIRNLNNSHHASNFHGVLLKPMCVSLLRPLCINFPTYHWNIHSCHHHTHEEVCYIYAFVWYYNPACCISYAT